MVGLFILNKFRIKSFHMYSRTSILLLLTFLSINLLAQSPPPNTDILVVDMKEKKGKITLCNWTNVTNRNGYDNQPSFFNNDYVLYSSHINGQTDIMIYDLYEEKTTNLTKTNTSEYSPYPIPGFSSFATVRVEEDGTQRLWMFQMDGKTDPSLVFEKTAPVGYFAWNTNNEVLMFVLGSPVTAVIANAEKVNDEIVTSNIGRTIRLIPGTNDFAFERREESGEVIIYKLDASSREFSKIITKPEGSVDWTITQDGTFITSVGTKLHMFNPKNHSNWQELSDLGSMASKGITRMAVSQENDKLAIVVNQ